MNLKSKIIYFLMTIHYDVTLRSEKYFNRHCNPSSFTPFEPTPPKKKIYQICFLVTMKKIINPFKEN